MIFGANQRLVIKTDAAATTNELDVVAGIVTDDSGSTIVPFPSRTNGTTAVGITTVPTGSDKQQCLFVNVSNTDTVSHDVFIFYDDNGTLYRLTKQTLPVGYTLYWSGKGWMQTSAAGSEQTGVRGEPGVDGIAKLDGLNDQILTSYTLAAADAGKCVRCTNAGAFTLTVPPNASVPIPLHTIIAAKQGGTGIVTVTAGAGVTLNAAFGAATTAQHDWRMIVQTDIDVWDVL